MKRIISVILMLPLLLSVSTAYGSPAVMNVDLLDVFPASPVAAYNPTAWETVNSNGSLETPVNTNLLYYGKESYSRAGNINASFIDNNFSTHRVSMDGTLQTTDWYAVTLPVPYLINKVIYAHGNNYADGGWFDTTSGMPKIQVQTSDGGIWTDVADITDYPTTSSSSGGGLTQGQQFVVSIDPVIVYGVRVIGKPVQYTGKTYSFSSIGELQASYEQRNVAQSGTASYSRAGSISASYLDNNFSTHRVTWDGTAESSDWYAVTFAKAQYINKAMYAHGRAYPDGGWFNAAAGKPKIQIQTQSGGTWTDVATISQYPATTNVSSAGLTDGQAFEVVFNPVWAYGIRVIGTPVQYTGSTYSFSSIAELQASFVPEPNALLQATPSYSRAGNINASYLDNDYATHRVTWDGTVQSSDWYAATLAHPVTINKVIYAHGKNYVDGGWFNTQSGKPIIQIQTTSEGTWTDVAIIADYPMTTNSNGGGLTEGQPFSVNFPPVTVYGFRVIGAPAQYPGTTYSFSSIGELQAFNDEINIDNSKWALGLNERHVFHTSIRHQQTKDNSWEMRIGKGGQIYSIVGPFGEAIPPQSPVTTPQSGGWIDEVIQPVAINQSLNNVDTQFPQSIFDSMAYYIHQAGVYELKDMDNLGRNDFFYSPKLAYGWDDTNKTYSMLSWGQQAHIPSINKSGILYYEKIRDVGDGVIEITYVISNFGTDLINDITLPWGGVRKSNLPDHVVSETNGSYTAIGGDFSDPANRIPLDETNGWAAFSQDADNASSYALGWVFGKDKHYGEDTSYQYAENTWAWGDANRDDYIVGGIGGNFNLHPGQTMYYRYYWVVGTLADVQSKANALADYVDYGLLSITEANTGQIPLYTKSVNGQTILSREGTSGQTPILKTYAKPVANSLPLFLLRDTISGAYKLSFDPYEFSNTEPFTNPYSLGDPKYETYQDRSLYKQYDGKMEYVDLLGFALPENKANSIDYSYIDLYDAVTDRTFYPGPTAPHQTLKVRAP
jgi:YHS domain-containing protein